MAELEVYIESVGQRMICPAPRERGATMLKCRQAMGCPTTMVKMTFYWLGQLAQVVIYVGSGDSLDRLATDVMDTLEALSAREERIAREERKALCQN